MYRPLKCDEYSSFVGKKFVIVLLRAVAQCDHVVFSPLGLHNNRGHVEYLRRFPRFNKYFV